MPLKLVPPRPGKSPNWSIRGTYLRVYVDRTTGTSDRKLAARILKSTREAIERGDYGASAEVANAPPPPPTFADAALAYARAGGELRFLRPIIDLEGPHALRDRPIAEIDQIAIDNAAHALLPNAAPATLNRQFYTPVSAVLKRAGIERSVKRPKGWRGSKATSWLEPEQAFSIVQAAHAIEPEFGLFLTSLLYTGMRLGDALRARVRGLMIDQALLYLPTTKNGEPRPVHLPPVLVQAFRNQPPRQGRPSRADGQPLTNGLAGQSRRDAGVPFLEREADEKLFRFHNGGKLRKMLSEAMKRAKVSMPPRQGGFHLFCHTYGTWMQRYGKLDTYGLTRTGRWKDPDSADRYNHTQASWEARQADLLPIQPLREVEGK